MPILSLTPLEAKLLARLLDMASDEFSRHGCNDFDLGAELKLDPAVVGREATELRSRLLETKTIGEEQYRDGARPYFYDWSLFSHFKNLVEKIENTEEVLLGMRERWPMYAGTRDAFVCLVGTKIGPQAFRALSQKCLGVPGTAAVDMESCRTLLDEEFAHRVVDTALKFLTDERTPFP